MEANTEIKNDSPKKKLPKLIVMFVVLPIIVFFVGKNVLYSIEHEVTDNAQVEMRLIPILSRVVGYVDKIYIEDYSEVKKGQLLIEIDSTELQLQMEEMQADYNQALSDVENAKAALTNGEANLSYSKGNVNVIELRQEKASSDYDRDKQLFEANAITRKQYDDSHSNCDISKKQLETGKCDIHVYESKLDMLRAQLTKAEAMAQLKKSRVDQQRLKLSYCRIYAIADGKLGKRNVSKGQYIQTGTPLFTIVSDESIWVLANFKENQIKHIQLGQEVDLKIDGFPKLELKGKVSSLSDATGAKFSLLPPDNASGNFVKVTQRIPIKIEILNEKECRSFLRAGMSLEVSVPIL